MDGLIDKRKLILVVEDDEAIRDSILELLETAGYAVTAAADGQEALTWLQKTPELPKLILLDLMMPIMDGYKFCEEKHRLTRALSIPIVIMSADGHVHAKQEQTGANHYLKKPIDIDLLIDTVHKFAV